MMGGIWTRFPSPSIATTMPPKPPKPQRAVTSEALLATKFHQAMEKLRFEFNDRDNSLGPQYSTLFPCRKGKTTAELLKLDVAVRARFDAIKRQISQNHRNFDTNSRRITEKFHKACVFINAECEGILQRKQELTGDEMRIKAYLDDVHKEIDAVIATGSEQNLDFDEICDGVLAIGEAFEEQLEMWRKEAEEVQVSVRLKQMKEQKERNNRRKRWTWCKWFWWCLEMVLIT